MTLSLSVKGIVGIYELKDRSKSWQITTQDKEFNLGVFEALTRKHCYVLVHDSDFREAGFPIVRHVSVGKKKICVLPALPFPEIKEANVVSSSPSYELDTYLRDLFKISKDTKLATLIVGFD